MGLTLGGGAVVRGSSLCFGGTSGQQQSCSLLEPVREQSEGLSHTLILRSKETNTKVAASQQTWFWKLTGGSKGVEKDDYADRYGIAGDRQALSTWMEWHQLPQQPAISAHSLPLAQGAGLARLGGRSL